MARGDIVLKILEVIGSAAIESADLFLAFMEAGYGASPKKIEYHLRRIQSGRGRADQGECEEVGTKEKYRKMLCWLKASGYIKESRKGGSKNKKISITLKGKAKIARLKQVKNASYPSAASYPKEPHSRVLIVVFDIPEKCRYKRDWVRSVLKNVGFTMVQKSVWRGQCKMPRTFIEDLRKLNIIQYLEVFEAIQPGTQ